MQLMNELLGLEEAKKPKCTCEEDKETCKIHGLKEEHEDQDHADDPNPISNVGKDEYEDSADFTNDMLEVRSHLEKAQELLNSEKFKKWMSLTDENYATDCVPARGAASRLLDKAVDAYNELLEEIDKAQ